MRSNTTHFIQEHLRRRFEGGRVRALASDQFGIDFCSNDYLGFSSLQPPWTEDLKIGSTGSRLISGNSAMCEELENQIATFHSADSALIFNSGYTANVGLLSAFKRDDVYFYYDEYSHASIRDGIRLSGASAKPYRHGDANHLEARLRNHKGPSQPVIVTESVDSMSGQCLPLLDLASLCDRYDALLIVDEAHGVGIFGAEGAGLVCQLELTQRVFARIITYGKAFGCFGASVVGSAQLKSYLINFARSFIYSTALPPSCITAIRHAYNLMKTDGQAARDTLWKRINDFHQAVQKFHLPIVCSPSAIHTFKLPCESLVSVAKTLRNEEFAVKAILSPTVKRGSERLRIVIHTFNTQNQINALTARLSEVI